MLGKTAKKVKRWVAKGKSRKVSALLAKKDQDIRLQAIDGLGQIGDDHAVHALIPLLADPDAQIRKQTAISMGVMEKDICKTHLQHRLSIEKDPDVVDALHDAIKRISQAVGLVK